MRTRPAWDVELFGQLNNAVSDYARYVDAAVVTVADTLGLRIDLG
ncbi:MAG: hypothetical protein ACR2KN_05325 [Geodermatophilaceae bacterium]